MRSKAERHYCLYYPSRISYRVPKLIFSRGTGGGLFEGGRLLQILSLRRDANSKRGAYLKLGANSSIVFVKLIWHLWHSDQLLVLNQNISETKYHLRRKISVIFKQTFSHCILFPRHLSSTSLELKVTKPEDSADQYAVAEGKAPYQSLSPSPDGVMERGLYLRRCFYLYQESALLILILLLTEWQSGASYLSQSLIAAMRNQIKWEILSTVRWK